MRGVLSWRLGVPRTSTHLGTKHHPFAFQIGQVSRRKNPGFRRRMGGILDHFTHSRLGELRAIACQQARVGCPHQHLRQTKRPTVTRVLGLVGRAWRFRSHLGTGEPSARALSRAPWATAATRNCMRIRRGWTVCRRLIKGAKDRGTVGSQKSDNCLSTCVAVDGFLVF